MKRTVNILPSSRFACQSIPPACSSFSQGTKMAVIVPAQRLRSKFSEPDMNGHKSWGLVRLELVFQTLDNTFIYLHLGQTAGVT